MNNKVLGIIGGGQLGMFTCIAAKKKGVKTIVFSTEPQFSAQKFCDNFIISNFTNEKNIKTFFDSADYFTIETENIPISFLKRIKKKKILPSLNVIEITQNRLKEKIYLNSLSNIHTVKYSEINNYSDLEKSAKNFNFNCILKTQEFGYDGKGQFKINQENLNSFKTANLKNFILEEKINFKTEISIIAVGNSKHLVYYPPVENIHSNSILRETIFPARVNNSIKNKAMKNAETISKDLKLNGVLAIEMFVTNNDQILINELAPRPHNSGHWTIDSCKFSQFDNLVSVITKEKVNQPEPMKNCRMINIIGNDYLEFNEISSKYRAYDYFKTKVRPSRKMGHYMVFE